MYKTQLPLRAQIIYSSDSKDPSKIVGVSSKYKTHQRHGRRLKKSVTFCSRAKNSNGMAGVSGQEIKRDLDCRSCHHFDIRRTGASEKNIEILVILKL